jgi:hypothetical protein
VSGCVGLRDGSYLDSGGGCGCVDTYEPDGMYLATSCINGTSDKPSGLCTYAGDYTDYSTNFTYTSNTLSYSSNFTNKLNSQGTFSLNLIRNDTLNMFLNNSIIYDGNETATTINLITLPIQTCYLTNSLCPFIFQSSDNGFLTYSSLTLSATNLTATVKVYKKFTSTPINNFQLNWTNSIETDKIDITTGNYSWLAIADNYDININSTSYYPSLLNFSINITNQPVTYIANLTNSNLTIYARDYYTNTTVTDFTIRIWNNKYPSSIYTYIAAANKTYIDLSENLNYTIEITPVGYAVETINLSKTASVINYTFYLRTTNSIYIRIFNETTNLQLINVPVSINVIGETLAYNYTQNATGSLFIGNLSSGNYRIEYETPIYQKRTYWFTMAEQSYNPIDLYLLPIDIGDLTLWNVEDQNGKPMQNVYIRVQRFYTTENVWKQVVEGKTGADGSAIIDLQLYTTWYKFLYEYDGIIRKVTEPMQVYLTTPPTVQLSTTTSSFTSLSTLLNLQYSLYYDNATNSFIYTYADSSNLVRQGCLKVKKIEDTSLTEICNNCVDSASATLTCQINSTEGSYNAVGTIDDDFMGVSQILEEMKYWYGEASKLSQNIMGRTGLLWSVIMLGGLLFLFGGVAIGGVTSAILGLVLFGFSIIMITGLFWIKVTTVIGIGAGILIILYLLQTRNRA